MPKSKHMKRYVSKFALLLSLIISVSVNAEMFSSFKADKFYIAEGRWFSNGDKFLFKINEGNANEENLTFEANPNELSDKIKYQICLQIKKDCQLNCEAISLRQIKLLKPWENATAMVPRPDGSYYETSEKACKGAL